MGFQGLPRPTSVTLRGVLQSLFGGIWCSPLMRVFIDGTWPVLLMGLMVLFGGHLGSI